MNAEQLLQHFERISEAPDAIPRLRRFILDRAVRGKLVEQEPSDEPAAELLKRIAAEKARLVNAGKIKAKPSLAEVTDDQAPYMLPSSWQWVRFTNIVDFSAGRTPSRNEPKFWNSGEYHWVSIGDMEGGQVLTATKETVSRDAREQVFGSEPEGPGTIIMSFKLTIGKIARLGIPAFHNEAIISIRPHIGDLDAYLFKVLPQFARQGDTKGAIKGATLNRESISNIFFPLPPLAEQYRIVAKVDELMSVCDQLEAAKAEREQCRDSLVAASLQGLNQPAKEEATFREHAHFTFNNLQRITTKAVHIKQLRQTILNLAVRGKLVEQDPGNSINSFPPCLFGPATECDQIPVTWLYVPLSSLLREDTRNGYSRKPDDAKDGVPILRISAGTARGDGLVAEEEYKLISGIDSVLLSQYQVLPGDLFACRFNGNKAYVGRLTLFTGYLSKQFIYPDKLIRIRLAAEIAYPLFLRWISSADLVRDEIESKCATTVGNWGISAGRLKSCFFPLPPLAEQQRIVAKVAELMAICDQLESQITATEQDSRRFLESVLADALAPGIDLREVAEVA